MTLTTTERVRVKNLLLVDEASCSSNVLESNSCTDQLKSSFANTPESSVKPDVKFIDKYPSYFKRRHLNHIRNSSDYYKCHLGAIKAAEKCNLDEIKQEMVCHYAKKDQCLGLAYSSGANVQLEDEVEMQNRKCHEKINGSKKKRIKGDYGH